jgi:hypothetical protein
MAKKMVQLPPPPEVKRSNPLKIVGIVLIAAVIATGAFLALFYFMGNPFNQQLLLDYVPIKVLSDSQAMVTFGQQPNRVTYTIYYKSTGHYDGNGDWINGYDSQTPIAVAVAGYTDRNFPATAGQTYEVLGIEVVVHEVHDDYIILLVKPL